jgi:hypothetical protein
MRRLSIPTFRNSASRYIRLRPKALSPCIRWFSPDPASHPTRSLFLPTSICRPMTDHLPTTCRPLADHLPTTLRTPLSCPKRLWSATQLQTRACARAYSGATTLSCLDAVGGSSLARGFRTMGTPQARGREPPCTKTPFSLVSSTLPLPSRALPATRTARPAHLRECRPSPPAAKGCWGWRSTEARRARVASDRRGRRHRVKRFSQFRATWHCSFYLTTVLAVTRA